MAKVFYWLKLKDDFFQQKEIKKLRKVAGGDTHTIIYLKLLLLSIKNEGYIEHEGVEEQFADELALVIDEDAENIKLTLGFLLKHNMLEVSNGTNYMLPKSLEMYGSETDAAERVRRHREQKALQCNTGVTLCNASVTTCNTLETKCNIEIEKRREDIEIEIEKRREDIEREKKKTLSSLHSTTCTEIIDYLNLICGSKYRATIKATQDLIKARLKEGFTVDDFKRVIDNKHSDWAGDPDFVQYLRPKTLFGTKFESYLNRVSPDFAKYKPKLSENDKAKLSWLADGGEMTHKEFMQRQTAPERDYLPDSVPCCLPDCTFREDDYDD